MQFPDPPSFLRRRFLSGALAGCALGLVPPSLRAAPARVTVIGAGLAGLHAARLLAAQDFEVVVLEARDRVGGRLYTLDEVPGRPEGGGNVIGPNYGRVIDTARLLGVQLRKPPGGAASGLLVGGQKLTRESWAQSPLNPLPEPLRTIAPDRLVSRLLRDNPLAWGSAWRDPAHAQLDRSAEQYFSSLGLDERSLRLIDVNNSYGNRLADTSLLSLYRVGSSIARAIDMRQPLYEVSSGNMRLPEAMAASLGGRVETGVEVTLLRQTAAHVEIGSRDGRSWRSEFAICTMPASLIRGLAFEPGLPAGQRAAFDSLEYAKVTQAHLVADTAWWETTGEPGGWWTDGPLGRIFGRPMDDGSGRFNLTCWINGDACDRIDSQDAAAAKAQIMEWFEQALPASRGRVRLWRLLSWRNERYSRGAWALWRPGDIGRYADQLLRPHGRVFFAGEHTAFANAGMEGAMESAERAVLEVLRKAV